SPYCHSLLLCHVPPLHLLTFPTRRSSDLTIINGLTPSISFNCSPNHFAKPLSEIPLASAKPPPKRINTPHGKSLATFQSIIRVCCSLFLAGIKNNKTAINIAIVPSATSEVSDQFFNKNSLLIHNKLAKIKTA